MRLTKLALCLFGLLGACAAARPARAQDGAPRRRVVIAAGVLLDGRGRSIRNTRVVVEGS